MPDTEQEKEYWKAQKHGSEKNPETIPVTHEPSPQQPAEERGERQETGKAIHRGGKSKGDVPGTNDKG